MHSAVNLFLTEICPDIAAQSDDNALQVDTGGLGDLEKVFANIYEI